MASAVASFVLGAQFGCEQSGGGIEIGNDAGFGEGDRLVGLVLPDLTREPFRQFELHQGRHPAIARGPEFRRPVRRQGTNPSGIRSRQTHSRLPGDADDAVALTSAAPSANHLVHCDIAGAASKDPHQLLIMSLRLLTEFHRRPSSGVAMAGATLSGHHRPSLLLPLRVGLVYVLQIPLRA